MSAMRHDKRQKNALETIVSTLDEAQHNNLIRISGVLWRGPVLTGFKSSTAI